MTFIGLLKGMWVTIKEFFRPRVTVYYPEEMLEVPERSGMPSLVIDPDTYDPRTGRYFLKCVACGVCARNCPDGVIKVVRTEIDGRKQPEVYQVDFRRCMFCGICIETCPYDALTFGRIYENAEYEKEKLLWGKEQLVNKEKYPELWTEKERRFYTRRRKEFRL